MATSALLLGRRPRFASSTNGTIDSGHPLAAALAFAAQPGISYRNLVTGLDPHISPTTAGLLPTAMGQGLTHTSRASAGLGYKTNAVIGAKVSIVLVVARNADDHGCWINVQQADVTSESAGISVGYGDNAVNFFDTGHTGNFLGYLDNGAAWRPTGAALTAGTRVIGVSATFNGGGGASQGYVDGVPISAVFNTAAPTTSNPMYVMLGNQTNAQSGRSIASTDSIVLAYVWSNRLLTGAEHASLAADPFQLLIPASRRSFFLGQTTSTTQALAGTIGATSSISGTLSLTTALGGTITGQSSLSGALGMTYGLAGTIGATSSLSGSLRMTYALSGTIGATSSISGTLSLNGAVTDDPNKLTMTIRETGKTITIRERR